MSEEDYKIAYENVMIANKMLEQENKQLKEQLEMLVKDDERSQEAIIEQAQKIDKAIEYIKSWVLDEYSIAVIDKEDDDCCYNELNAREKLLEILEANNEQ